MAPKVRPNKVTITIRLNPSTVDTYRENGRGWQTIMSADLDRIAQKRAQLQSWKPATSRKK